MKTEYRVKRRGSRSRYYDVWKGMIDPAGDFRPIDLRPSNPDPLDHDRANDPCAKLNGAERTKESPRG
jgi:hypothetical protein